MWSLIGCDEGIVRGGSIYSKPKFSVVVFAYLYLSLSILACLYI